MEANPYVPVAGTETQPCAHESIGSAICQIDDQAMLLPPSTAQLKAIVAVRGMTQALQQLRGGGMSEQGGCGLTAALTSPTGGYPLAGR